MKNKKIVFFDIDGTIYKYNTGMPRDTYEAIIKLKENGHIPVICTGRTKCMIYKQHMEPGFENIVAGAGTYVEINGREELLAEIEQNEAQRVIDGFLKYHFMPVAEGRDFVYLGKDESDLTTETKKVLAKYRENMPEAMRTIDDKDKHISKVSAMFTNHSDKEGMIKEFEKDYTIIIHGNELMELVPKGFNKAKGIEIMIHKLGISHENTYAFGDSNNDIDMLEYVKYGCAMGNSSQSIKDRCRYVTKDFDKGGIAYALKKLELI